MTRIRTTDVRTSVRHMLIMGRIPEAYKLLKLTTDNIRQARDWRVLCQIWEEPTLTGSSVFRVEQQVLREETQWRVLIAQILSGCQDEIRLEEWLRQCQAIAPLEPELIVLQAFVLICAGKYQQTLESLQPVLKSLSGNWLGLAHRRMLWAAHRLQLPWDQHLLELRQHLQGRNLGLALLDAAHCAYSEHRSNFAQTLAEEALQYLKDDGYHKAWIHVMIGLNLLRDCDEQAGEHFEQALKLTHQSSAKPLRAKALAGLAAYRRVHGEWRIALELYRRAEAFTLEIEDSLERAQIQLNTGRTQRLAGWFNESKATLQNLIQADPKNADDCWLELSATYLISGQIQQARDALEHVKRVFGADVHLKTILEAELFRQLGKPDLALDLIRSLPFETRVVREEVVQFGALFSLLVQRPNPLLYPQQTVIRVVAKPKLQVFVNDRLIPKFNDTQDTLALLYLLKFPKKHIKTDELALAIFDFEVFTENESSIRDLTNRIIERLRYKLEYPQSIREDRKHYWLDPETIWVRDALPKST